MLIQSFLTVESGATEELLKKMDFQQGTVIFTVVPIKEDKTDQESKKFIADVAWSNNNKYYVIEHLCDGSCSSSGESLVTVVQAPYVKVRVTNKESTEQTYYVGINVPGTASPGV